MHQALAAGAATYLLKESALDDLAGVVRAVHNGARPLSEDVQRILARRSNQTALTAREIGVLELIAQGLSNNEAGKTLGITEETVKVHVRNIMDKLNVRDRTKAVTMAAQPPAPSAAGSTAICLRIRPLRLPQARSRPSAPVSRAVSSVSPSSRSPPEASNASYAGRRAGGSC